MNGHLPFPMDAVSATNNNATPADRAVALALASATLTGTGAVTHLPAQEHKR